MVRLGRPPRPDAPTWLYDFRLAHPDTGLSAHCAELPFAWDCLDAPQVASSCHPDPPQSLADAMHGAWVEFVRDHRAPWPAWSAEGVAMIFDAESAARPAFALERRIAQTLRRRCRPRDRYPMTSSREETPCPDRS